MKRYFKLIMCVLLGFLFMSCKKYLDKKSDNSQVVPTSIEDLQAILDNSVDMNFNTPGYGTASADDHFILNSTYDAQNVKSRDSYIWLDTESEFSQDWAKSYLAIYNSNLCLERIQKISKSNNNELTRNMVEGSALFFRSYYFLQLVWTYAKAYDPANANNDMGIILRLGSDFNVKSVRSNNAETYDRIIMDIKTAVPALPDHISIATRPSKAAAYGLLARTYLSMRNYENSLKYADLSLNAYDQLMDYNNDPDLNASSNNPFKQFNKETIFLTKMSSNYGAIIPPSGLIDTVLYNSYSDNDLRKLIFFRTSGSYRRFKGSYSGSASAHFTGITTAEMYLTRAECYARKGDVDAAMADLNTLMKKRWKNTVPYPTFTAANANDALAKILTERRKELLFRGLRWMDIKRLNKEGADIVLKRVINNKTYTLQPNDSRYALPLPSDIIRITGVPQN